MPGIVRDSIFSITKQFFQQIVTFPSAVALLYTHQKYSKFIHLKSTTETFLNFFGSNK